MRKDTFVSTDGTIDKREIATIINGRVKAVVNFVGIISFYKDDPLILREYFRYYDGTLSKESRCLKIRNREWKGVIGGISAPFAVSSMGYGFLWNNPAVGRVTFGKNYYEWIANATKEMDY